MQNHWNYAIHISWLVPGGYLQFAGGEKHKPKRLEGEREILSGMQWAQESKCRPLREAQGTIRTQGA